MPTTNSNDFCNVQSIHGFPDLYWPAKTEVTSLRFGSTLLLSGPPGAGKTTFALATIRAMMAHAQRTRSDCKTIAYYISSETNVERLKENYESFGWFKDQVTHPQSFRFSIDNPEPDVTNFYCITPLLEVDRPVPSPEELVNGVFNRIVHTLVPSEAPLEGAKTYVIIDSITALLKGCEHPGEERRQTHEIMRRLQDRFGKDNLALTMLLAEQDHRSQDQGATITSSSTDSSVDDYLTDMVFRLYVRNLPLGRRARILDVVKSQGANMSLGEHTWQIISEDNHDAILRHTQLRDNIVVNCFEFEKKRVYLRDELDGLIEDKWGGIVIFPRPRLLSKISQGKTRAPIPGAGSAATPSNPIAATPDQRDASASDDRNTGTIGLELDVSPGKITLIAGPMGCGKSTLCRQFLQAGQGLAQSSVLISFEIPSASESKSSEGFTTVHFTQSQFDLNVLVTHINCILDHGCHRLAFDGLSEWVTTFEKPEAARVLEALMATVKRQRTKPPPSVFMTYEMPLDDDPLGPAAVGAAADNLVVVRKVPINDELRRVIYVLKRDNRPSQDDQDRSSMNGPSQSLKCNPDPGPTHEHPAELTWEKVDGKEVLSVNPTSFEAFTGLLSRSREVRPARLLIQLFAENAAEQEFNTLLEEQLTSQFKQRVELTFTRFNLSEIGSTLETAFGAGKPSEAFNLAIHSVDEWWLKSRQTTQFLRPLQPQRVQVPKRGIEESKLPGKARGPKKPKGPDYRDFWWFEVEKGLTPGKDGRLAWHAIPAYLDFGMFCINPAAMDLTVQDNYRLHNPAPPVFTSLAAMGYHAGALTIPEASPTQQRRIWNDMLAAVPRLWARPSEGDSNWFTLQKPAKGSEHMPTVLEYALTVTNQWDRDNLERMAVFSFDSSTRETCSCMFFELAWAFGATESFLADKPDSVNAAAAQSALQFLQFLVMEGLMPARSSTHSRNHKEQPILFSRQWYSTIRKFAEDALRAASNSTNAPLAPQGQLFALPFMPTGLPDQTKRIHSLLDDIIARHKRWLCRAVKFVSANAELSKTSDGPDKILSDLTSGEGDDTELKGEQPHMPRLKRALCAYKRSREWLLEVSQRQVQAPVASDTAPQDWTADLDDLIELACWIALRLQLFFGEKGGDFPRHIARNKSHQPAAKALYDAQWVRHNLPDLSQLDADKWSADHVIATGYVCSGSWMYGVDEKARSSEIQSQVLVNLTSLDTADRRAASGAGMPARKDFFYLKGEKPVVGMEYLQWREFLRYSGARARRRDRVLFDNDRCNEGADNWNAPFDPTELYNTIHGEMLACLRSADLWRQAYAVADSSQRTIAIRKMIERAKLAVNAIYVAAKEVSGENTRTVAIVQEVSGEGNS